MSCPAVTWAKAMAGLQPLPELDSRLLQGGTKGPRKPHWQRITMGITMEIMGSVERSSMGHHYNLCFLLCSSRGLADCANPTHHPPDLPYQAPERLVDPLKEEIRTMKILGVIELSMSEWSSPLVNVPKKNNTLYVCINYHKLNAQLRFNAYPMLWVDDLLESIGQAQCITTLDLCKGYWRVPLDRGLY